MKEIEYHHKYSLHVATKRSGFFTTVCTISTFVILRKHKSAARSATATKEITWIYNREGRVGGCGLALHCVLTANDMTWKCITWHPGGSYSSASILFGLFYSFSRQPWTTKFSDIWGGDKTLFCDSRRANFLSTELIAKCAVADLEAKEPLLVVALKFV